MCKNNTEYIPTNFQNFTFFKCIIFLLQSVHRELYLEDVIKFPRFSQVDISICKSSTDYHCKGSVYLEKLSLHCILVIGCEDSVSGCAGWAAVGHCETLEWMLENCQKSCDSCGKEDAILL